MNESDLIFRRKQLLYRAQHRGFKEADLLVGGFASAEITSMSEEDLAEFEALLQLSDHDLFNWAVGNAPAPASILGPVFKRLQSFNVAALTAPKLK